MVRSPCCEKSHTNKGAWTREEDQILINHINRYGEGNWRSLPKAAGLARCGKSCRLRWINYLRPDLKRGSFTPEEDEIIIRLHTYLGNKWSLIAGRLPGRTDNEVKNYWNTHVKRKLINSGIDPQTHRPIDAAAAIAAEVAEAARALRNASAAPARGGMIDMNDHTKFLPLSTTENSSSVQENSTMTEESHLPPPPPAEEETGLDLELSLAPPSHSKYGNSPSFNSASSSSSSAETPFRAAGMVAPPMCMCGGGGPFGFRRNQWCSNCQFRGGFFRY
ncbi:hypothetical protein ACS0TY_036143 [Phlomoides rotata]